MRQYLLACDAIINLCLGVPLMAAPGRVTAFLGLPEPGAGFYAGILGAVLTGIGAALCVQILDRRWQVTGLGLEGAACINVFGALALSVWLLAGKLKITPSGRIFLWSVVVLVLFVSALEIALHLQMKRRHQTHG